MSFPKPTDTPGYVCSKDALGHRWWSTPRSKNHLASETDEDMFFGLWVSWKKMKCNLRYRQIYNTPQYIQILYLNEASFSAEFPLWKPMSGVYLPLKVATANGFWAAHLYIVKCTKQKRDWTKAIPESDCLLIFWCLVFYVFCDIDVDAQGYITSHGIKRTVPVWMILISGIISFRIAFWTGGTATLDNSVLVVLASE